MNRQTAFTLTELLIALALFAVLAAIAVPITIESQARARVAHARKTFFELKSAINAYILDWNTIFPDNNDGVTPAWRKNRWWFSKENPGVTPDVYFINGQWMENYYTKVPFVPLTTPVAYRATIPLDPFSSVVPMGIDTRETYGGSSLQGLYAYAVLFAAGPDRTEGNWYRGAPGQYNMSIPYDPSNGAISRGDMMMGIPLTNEKVMLMEWPLIN